MKHLKALGLVVIGLSVGVTSFAQHRGGNGGGYPPGTKGNPGPAPQRGNPNSNPGRGGYQPGPYAPGTKGNPGYQPGTKGNPGYNPGYNPGRNNGGYRPQPQNPYNPYPRGTKGNPGYRPYNPVVIRHYDRGVGYVGNRVVYRDRFDRGMRVRTFYYNNTPRDCYYRPVSYFGFNFYVYNSRFDMRFYSRFPRAYPAPYSNYWFHANDSWYYRYQNYYGYRSYYYSPSQWLLDYYYSNLLRDYQQELIEQQQIIAYQNQIIQSQMSETYRMQLESQIQQSMYNPQDVGVGMTLNDTSHLYVVSEEVDVLDQYGQSCSITRGDVLKLNYTYTQGSPVATMQVVASKDESCDAGSIITLSLEQLQEFENSMSAQIDEGMNVMSNDQYLRSTLSP